MARASDRRWPPTRCRVSAPPPATTRRPRATHASTTTPTCCHWARNSWRVRERPKSWRRSSPPRAPRSGMRAGWERSRRSRNSSASDPGAAVTEQRIVDAVVRAVLAQLQPEEPPCACHAAVGGCCPDRLGRLVGEGAARFGLQAPRQLYPREIARHIDHTLLKADATRDQIEALCREALEHGFATVCVNPVWVRLCSTLLRGSE